MSLRLVVPDAGCLLDWIPAGCGLESTAGRRWHAQTMNVPATEGPDSDDRCDDSTRPAVAPPPTARRPIDRRQLDRVFGDVLPTSTLDDLPDAGRDSEGTPDDWFYANRPPHHEP